MNLFLHKKAEAVTIILVLIIVVVFIGYLVNIGSRECRTDSQCTSGQYCGSDFACHDIPVVEKTVVQNNLILPSFILGIAVVIAAIVLKWGNFPSRKKKQEDTQEKIKLNTP